MRVAVIDLASNTARRIAPERAGTVLAGALLLVEASRRFDRPLELARGGLREGAAIALAAADTLAA